MYNAFDTFNKHYRFYIDLLYILDGIQTMTCCSFFRRKGRSHVPTDIMEMDEGNNTQFSYFIQTDESKTGTTLCKM